MSAQPTRESIASKLFDVACVLAIAYFLTAAIGKFAPKDDTDPTDSRSGLGLYQDALTGCEYISGGPWPAALTPRLNADGTQVCRQHTGGEQR